MITKGIKPKVFYNFEENGRRIENIVSLLSAVVGSTFGPHGRLVSFDIPGAIWPTYTKDGVTVASNFTVEDRFEQHIADTIIQAANRQLSECGDGTTLTILLACHLLLHFLKDPNNLENINSVKKDIRSLETNILDLVLQQARPATEDQLLNVVKVALNNDPTLQEVVSEAVKHTGDLGVILPRFSRSGKTFTQFDQGYQWRSGVNMAHEFCLNIDGGVNVKNPHVMIVNDILIHEDDIQPIVDKILRHHAEIKGVPAKEIDAKDIPALVIIAHNFEHRAVQIARRLRQLGKMHVVFMQPEGGYGTEDRAYHLSNIAAFTGAKICDGDAGISKKNITIDQLGTCAMLHADTQGACFSGGNDKTIKERITHLTALKEQFKHNDAMGGVYVERSIARLNSLFCTIHVGGNSESEIRERLDRVEDALKSVYSAKELGVVPGGGVALFKADPFGKLVGRVAVQRILKNAGITETFMHWYPGYRLTDSGVEFDVDMFDIGIVDPAKNICSALKNAVSVVMCIIDTEWFLVEKNDG